MADARSGQSNAAFSGGASAKSGATPVRRLMWVDASRAVAVLLVVLFHVTIGHYYLMDWLSHTYVGRWTGTNQILSVIRMPLLFALSGALASGKVSRGFGGGRSIESAVTNYWLYVVWLFAYGFFVLLMPNWFATPHKVESLGAWLIQLLVPNTYLWYLFALAAYIVFFTALRRVPWWLTLAALFAAHLVSVNFWSLDSPLWTRIITYAVYFGLGLYGRPVLRHFAGSPVAAIGAAVVSYSLYQEIGMSRLSSIDPSGYAMGSLLALFYVAMGLTAVGFVGCLVRVPVFATVLTRLGRHTLGVYALHIPVVTVINVVILSLPQEWFAPLGDSAVVDLIWPLVASALVVAGCVYTEKMIRAVPALRFLFQLPAPLARVSERLRRLVAGHKPTRDEGVRT